MSIPAPLDPQAVEAIRRALRDKKIQEDDPAFLVLTALEMSLRALETIPATIKTAVADVGANLAAQATVIIDADSEARLLKNIDAAAGRAAANAANSGLIKAKAQLQDHLDNRYVAGWSAAATVMLMSGAACFQVGRYEQAGYALPLGTGLVQIIWNAPAGIVAAISGVCAFLFYVSQRVIYNSK